ncbi:MAG: DUF4160 domain-containing protein [Spirochaetes bacterium]|nr:DUF4160 domain-containing protein [Spirochaetota bacterium]
MPTIAQHGPYRLFFYSGDRDEPPHVHVERDDKVAKVWFDPVTLAQSGGFGRKEISDVLDLVSEHEESILRRSQ